MSILRQSSIQPLGAAAVVASLCLATTASAHEVTPMRVFLAPHAGQSSAVVTVANSRTDPLPFEVRVLRREVAADGSQTFSPAEEQFAVFPPQALVAPQQSQAIRFQYIGDPALAQSAAYVLQVKEVPVMPEGFSGVITVYDFGVAVYVQAANARADIAVSAVERNGDDIRFSIVNTGSDYGFLAQRSVTLSAGGEQRVLDPEVLAAQIENPILPPNSTRHFSLQVPGLPAGTVAVDIGPAR
ncbi:molecular chaperone [Brevundimonas sp. BAL450]|uniref:P pilus assembly protein, chaperone PapD n=1 Tax=Brevundimonas abyssalis TAR-001 TaxID=1391729 RepID=A0A8E0NC11_9CAUL|nr:MULTISPECIES: fimbria/pilus periplasmic chaperone [Brevundimonas]MBG7616087.1 molecular chaperone [Brevundimonas sp. BAL450]GAD59582.1 P pilus assembly protein, chaperone PapD [Brevundimonas abyssalis TAR-001]